MWLAEFKYSIPLSKIYRGRVLGFHRIFDQNLYILAFFDKKSCQLPTAKQIFHFHRKIKRNVHIWQFLARKRGRCGKRNLSISISKICRCVA